VSEFTCLKVLSLEQEQEKKNMDPHPNHSADFATFLHITNSTVLSQTNRKKIHSSDFFKKSNLEEQSYSLFPQI
jgi:hypothetical protein